MHSHETSTSLALSNPKLSHCANAADVRPPSAHLPKNRILFSTRVLKWLLKTRQPDARKTSARHVLRQQHRGVPHAMGPQPGRVPKRLQRAGGLGGARPAMDPDEGVLSPCCSRLFFVAALVAALAAFAGVPAVAAFSGTRASLWSVWLCCSGLPQMFEVSCSLWFEVMGNVCGLV